MLDWLWHLSFNGAAVVFLVLNIFIFFGALFSGVIFDRCLPRDEHKPRPRITSAEIILSASTACINAAITAIGWLLWKAGYIRLDTEASLGIVVRDTLVLLLLMDLMLYILHRIAHLPVFYRIAHYKHHEYRQVRVLTLFVMSPLEALGFGTLWVALLCCFTSSVESVIIFLNLNLWFGILAHTGHRVFPPVVVRLLNRLYIASPDFHKEHHNDEAVNMGFYTLIWDHLFDTHRRT